MSDNIVSKCKKCGKELAGEDKNICKSCRDIRKEKNKVGLRIIGGVMGVVIIFARPLLKKIGINIKMKS